MEHPCGLGLGSLSRREFDDAGCCGAGCSRVFRSYLMARIQWVCGSSSEITGELSFNGRTLHRSLLTFHICCVGHFSSADWRPPCSLPCGRDAAADIAPVAAGQACATYPLAGKDVEHPLAGLCLAGLGCSVRLEKQLLKLVRFQHDQARPSLAHRPLVTFSPASPEAHWVDSWAPWGGMGVDLYVCSIFCHVSSVIVLIALTLLAVPSRIGPHSRVTAS